MFGCSGVGFRSFDGPTVVVQVFIPNFNLPTCICTTRQAMAPLASCLCRLDQTHWTLIKVAKLLKDNTTGHVPPLISGEGRDKNNLVLQSGF